MTTAGAARSCRALVAIALAGGTFAAHAAGVTLDTAWMRPAAAGAPAARVYVDIASPVALQLVGATTPVAAQVQLVHVARLDDPASETVVPSMAVRPGAVTRLAYRGDHLRLVAVKQDLANGTPVPLTLVFRDAQGNESRATTQVTVRGLVLPRAAISEGAGTPGAAPAEGSPAGTMRP